MSQTVTVRLDDQVRARLVDASMAMKIAPGTLAARLITEGLDRPLVVPADGELVSAVRARFADDGDGAVEAALALTLARQVESGATSSAGRLMDVLRDRYARTTARVEELEAEFLAELATPRPHTYCAGCRQEELAAGHGIVMRD